MQHQIPPGDVLIHAGDFTSIGKLDEVKKFSEFLKTLDDKFQYKVVIAGEFTFDYSLILQYIKLKLGI
jgi:hypothetical protein